MLQLRKNSPESLPCLLQCLQEGSGLGILERHDGEEDLGRIPAVGVGLGGDLGSVGSAQAMLCIPLSWEGRWLHPSPLVAGQGRAGSWSVLGTTSFWGSLGANAGKGKTQ